MALLFNDNKLSHTSLEKKLQLDDSMYILYVYSRKQEALYFQVVLHEQAN